VGTPIQKVATEDFSVPPDKIPVRSPAYKIATSYPRLNQQNIFSPMTWIFFVSVVSVSFLPG